MTSRKTATRPPLLRSRSARLWLVALLLLCWAADPGARAQNAYEWKPVTIKGGGFVTGVVTHPAAPNVIYCRTDVGGAFRWKNNSSSWVPLTDFVGYADPHLIGIESLALDPTDPNRVYLAAQAYTFAQAAILRSTDMGATFTRFNVPFAMGGNGEGRSNGERLAVDPNKPNILFFGSRLAGLWRSTDSGANWNQMTGFPVTTTANDAGAVFVEFVRESGTPGTATPVLFVGVSQGGDHLFRSVDGGVTWAAVPTGAPADQMPHHAAQDGLGNMYLTFGNGAGPNGVTAGSVRKMNLATLATTNVTPPTGQGGFAGVSVDRQNPATLLVTTINRWWPAPYDQIYRSTNGGTSWKATLASGGPLAGTAPWSVARSSHWVGDVKIDPFDPNRAFFVTGYGVIACTNLTASDTNGTVNWTFTNDGLEETVPKDVKSPPAGPLVLTALADIGGFQHADPDLAPPLADYAPHRGTQPSVDFGGPTSAVFARTFGSSPYGQYSLNAGGSWQDFPAFPPTADTNDTGQIAVSADGTRFVWNPTSSTAYWSANNGATWTASLGAPTGSLVPVADRVNGLKFYLYSGGRMWLSTDGGVNFTQGGVVNDARTPCAVPGFEGHLWVPCSGNTDGLWRSTNSGAGFTQVSAGVVQEARSVGVGKAAPGQSYPAVYIFGRIGNVWGLYRSDDQGANWVRINDNLHQYGSIGQVTGDMRTYGRVYFSTGGSGMGRGVLYGDIPNNAVAPAAPSGLVATVLGSQQINLEWNDHSTAETGFKIERSTDGVNFTQVGTVPTGETLFRSTALNPVTTYHYRVRAYNPAGHSAFSAIVSATTPSAVPLPPADLLATAGDEQVGLTWTPAASATGYRVKRALVSGGPYALIASPTAASHVDTYLVNRTEYFYVVSAVNSIGEGADSAEVRATPVPPSAKLSGTGIGSAGSYNNLGNDRTKVFNGVLTDYYDAANANGDWAGLDLGAGGAVLTQVKYCPRTGYSARMNGAMLQGANQADFSDAVTLYTVTANASSPPTNTLTAQPVTNGTAFRYVRYIAPNTNARCNVGEVEFWGWKINDQLPAAPANLAADEGDTQVVLSWNLAASPSTYTVRRGPASGGPFTPIATGLTGNTFTDPGLTNTTTYFYTVAATNFAGEGAPTAPLAATPHVTFETWQGQYFNGTQLGNPAVSGAGADANGDGYKNLLAYAFNASPWANLAPALPVVQLSGGYLTITFTRRKPPTDVGYTVQVSGNLTIWNSGPTFTTELPPVPLDADTERVTVRDNTPAGSAPRYLRVEITH